MTIPNILTRKEIEDTLAELSKLSEIECGVSLQGQIYTRMDSLAEDCLIQVAHYR